MSSREGFNLYEPFIGMTLGRHKIRIKQGNKMYGYGSYLLDIFSYKNSHTISLNFNVKQYGQRCYTLLSFRIISVIFFWQRNISLSIHICILFSIRFTRNYYNILWFANKHLWMSIICRTPFTYFYYQINFRFLSLKILNMSMIIYFGKEK